MKGTEMDGILYNFECFSLGKLMERGWKWTLMVKSLNPKAKVDIALNVNWVIHWIALLDNSNIYLKYQLNSKFDRTKDMNGAVQTGALSRWTLVWSSRWGPGFQSPLRLKALSVACLAGYFSLGGDGHMSEKLRSWGTSSPPFAWSIWNGEQRGWRLEIDKTVGM